MDDLPDPASDAGNKPLTQVSNNPINQPKTDDTSLSGGDVMPTGISGISKEVETGGLPPAEHLRPAAPETELPKEVAQAGVKIHPTTVPIPPNVTQLGIKPAGANIPQATPESIALPLSEDQIAQGLHESVVSSWRWLAQWCIRRLKQMHVGLKTIHGTLTRVRT